MILYLVNSTLCLALLLAVYHLILERERAHHFNRCYLVFSLAFSFSIPLIPVGMEANLQSLFDSYSSSILLPMSLGAETGGGAITGSPADNMAATTPAAWLLVLYGVITALLLARFAGNLYRIIIRAWSNRRIRYGEAELVLVQGEVTPYSFGRYIFLNEQHYREGRFGREVLIHEYAHVSQRHTFDILLVEFLKAILWFNPFLYLHKRAIQLNHEYLADRAVIDNTGRIPSYLHLLLRASRNPAGMALTSNFNCSMTKKRIMMITRTSSSTKRLIKQILMIPLLVGGALLFGCQLTSADPELEEVAAGSVFYIDIPATGAIQVNGETGFIVRLDDQLAGLSDVQEMIVALRAQSGADPRTVREIQDLLRNHKVRRISYAIYH